MSANKNFDKFWEPNHSKAGWSYIEKALAKQAFEFGYKLGLENAEKERMAKIKAEREAYEDWQDRYRAENRRQ